MPPKKPGVYVDFIGGGADYTYEIPLQPVPPSTLQTEADFAALDGVVLVRPLVPGPGDVTLVVEPGYEGLAEEIKDRIPLGMRLFTEPLWR